MTALRFQAGGRHQTSPASLRGRNEEAEEEEEEEEEEEQQEHQHKS